MNEVKCVETQPHAPCTQASPESVVNVAEDSECFGSCGTLESRINNNCKDAEHNHKQEGDDREENNVACIEVTDSCAARSCDVFCFVDIIEEDRCNECEDVKENLK